MPKQRTPKCGDLTAILRGIQESLPDCYELVLRIEAASLDIAVYRQYSPGDAIEDLVDCGPGSDETAFACIDRLVRRALNDAGGD